MGKFTKFDRIIRLILLLSRGILQSEFGTFYFEVRKVLAVLIFLSNFDFEKLLVAGVSVGVHMNIQNEGGGKKKDSRWKELLLTDICRTMISDSARWTTA